MAQLFPIAAITDEFSPDIEQAVRSMSEVGMQGAELRMIFGKNIIDLSDDELDRALQIVHEAGLTVVSIASPLLKCVLPDAPEIDVRFQQDMFAAKHGFDDQPRMHAGHSKLRIEQARGLFVCSPTGGLSTLRGFSIAWLKRCVGWRSRLPAKT